MELFYIFFILLAAALFLLFLGRIKILRETISTGCSLVFFLSVIFLYGIKYSYHFTFLSFHFTFSLNPLSWFFLLLVSFFALLTTVYSAGADFKKGNLGWFYFIFFIKNLAMAGLILASDLLCFFVFWEIMSLFTYFMMVYNRREKDFKSGFRYLILSLLGSTLFMAALVSLNIYAGTLSYAGIAQYLLRANNVYLLFIFCGLAFSFLVKSATMPLHYWFPSSYSNAPTTFTSFLSTISSRMGVYGFIVLIYIFFPAAVSKWSLGHFFSIRYLLGVLAAFTMVVPTFTALMQDDAKKLMTWHAIGQGGYILLGIVIGTPMALAGGLFHILNYASYILLIFLAIGAVEMRTGETNLNKLGGLIKKMPVSFLAILFGIIGLAGIPPMNGFVSKWLLYNAALKANFPFLALAAFLGSIGTILSVYKFIHNIFLGQLREKYRDVKEAPFLMQVPMYVLMAVVWGLGIFPGLALKFIASVEVFLHVKPIAYSLGGVNVSSGHLNMLVVNITMMTGFLIAAGIYFLGRKRIIVSQYNNYAAGNFLNEDIPYDYNYHFYASLQRFIDELNKDLINRAVTFTGRVISIISDAVRKIFSGQLNYSVLYIAAAFLFILGGLFWF